MHTCEVYELSGLTPSPASTPQRNLGIDLLRGLAILLVVLNHFSLRIPLQKTIPSYVVPYWLLQGITTNGYEAVFVFFVISGFLIAGNALRRWGALEQIDVRSFYTRRFARIAPCLIALVLTLCILHIFGVEDYVIDGPGQSLAAAVGAALGLHINWYEGRTGYLPGSWDVLWSLSIEEVFYIAFPLICLLTRRRVVLVPLLLVLAISLPWTHAALKGDEIWQEKAYLPGMSAIAVGVLGALLAARWRAPVKRTSNMLGCLGAVGLMAVLFEGSAIWNVLRDGYLLLLALSALCLLLMFQQRNDASQWWSTQRLSWLRSWGRLSYEIYLTHMFVVYGIVRLYKYFGENSRLSVLCYVIGLPLCWLLAITVERWFSGPCERWLRGAAKDSSMSGAGLSSELRT